MIKSRLAYGKFKLGAIFSVPVLPPLFFLGGLYNIQRPFVVRAELNFAS